MSSLLSALAEFASAGLRPRTPLAKAIVLALLVKLCVVVAMRLFLFSGEAAPPADDEATRLRLLGPASVASERPDIHD
jgi:hypothetical protein